MSETQEFFLSLRLYAFKSVELQGLCLVSKALDLAVGDDYFKSNSVTPAEQF